MEDKLVITITPGTCVELDASQVKENFSSRIKKDPPDHNMIPSLSSKRRHVTEKHVLTGCKHDMLGNETFKVLRPLSKLSQQSWRAFKFVAMFSINKYCRNFKPGIPLSKDFRNEVIQMVPTQRISEICERYRSYESSL